MVASAMVRLKQGMSDRGGLSVEGVQSSTEDEVRTFIYGVGFHNNKAKYETRFRENRVSLLLRDVFFNLVSQLIIFLGCK